MKQINENELNTVTAGTKIPYIVQKGDTLGDLATKFKCTVEDICKWNNIEDPNNIIVNQVLKIYF